MGASEPTPPAAAGAGPTEAPPRATGPVDDVYDLLAPLYDAWQEGEGRPFSGLVWARLEPWLARAAGRGAGGGLAFVDLACGTGALLASVRGRFPEARLAGVDRNAAMLARARERAGASRVAWIEGSMEALPASPALAAGTFDAAGCFFDALNHLAGEAALAAALAGAARLLRPGGFLAFDLTNEAGFRAWWAGARTSRLPQGRLRIETRFDVAAGLGHAHVELRAPDGKVREARLTERLFTDRAVLAGLAAAGLAIEAHEPWAPFAFDESGKTWWLARRAA